jgi:hypothetical protein
MAIALEYKTMPTWPVLSWLAVCESGTDRVLVLHGQDVQTRPDWFCEAVWDGAYSEANFDQTDLIYGSGARCRGGRITFVSSGATTDRLQFLERDALVLLSNSFACLLAISESDPDPQFRGYINLFSSIGRGYKRCDRLVTLEVGTAHLVYFQNLEWDGETLREMPKVIPNRDFSTYEQYIAFLTSSLQRLAANLSSPDRAFAYIWQGSLSRGYDSPTAVALAKEAGLGTALSFHESRPGIRDDGGAIAEALGLEIKLVDRLGWQNDGAWEPLFLSADGQGKEIMLSAAPALLRRRVFVTGNGGDYVWSMNPKTVSTELARDEYASLSLTEFRLHCGFIHFPLPFMGMSQMADVCRISQSPEMRQWHSGGSYSRPICRRVLEERGVPRDVFGIRKTGASVRFVIGQDPWSSKGHKAFLSWILNTSVLSEHPWTRRAWLAAVLTFLRSSLLLRSFVPRRFDRVVDIICRRIVCNLCRHGVEDYAFLWGIACVRQSYQGDDDFQINDDPNSGTKEFLNGGPAQNKVSRIDPRWCTPSQMRSASRESKWVIRPKT